MQVILVAFGSVLAFTQTMTLFVLKDLRERIMRLEGRQMK